MNFRKNLKNTSYYLFLGLCLIFFGLIVFYLKGKTVQVVQPSNSPASLNTSTEARVIKVFDGDTIEISTGEKVRYIGIDAPEVYPTRNCFSEESKVKNENLVLGKNIKLVKDVSEIDKYGRLLRYVYVENLFVNDELTKGGYTKVMTVPPDVKYKELFQLSQDYAKENKLGLWSVCPVSHQIL